MIHLLLAIGILAPTEYGESVKGLLSSEVVEAVQSSCSPDPCPVFCAGQINNPYCMVWGSQCLEQGGGGAQCTCQYFCVTSEGGVHHTPREQGPHWLAIIGPDGWDETGGI
jgi:hypothetical protein